MSAKLGELLVRENLISAQNLKEALDYQREHGGRLGFNLVKLGAVGTEYLVDFYGPMADGVNDGDETDRLAVAWDLTGPGQPYGIGGSGDTRGSGDTGGTGDREAAPTTHTAPDGAPLARRDLDERHVWCRVPADIVALRAAEPELALRWRRAVREVFTKAFADGFRATGMSRDGWYALTRDRDRDGDREREGTDV